MPLSREPQLDPYDIKLLRLFINIVQYDGFSGAQAQLNISATAISTQMATLESRLGMRLCNRGRVGFKLTEQGARVYEAALRLEEAIGKFREEMGGLRGKLVGELAVGIADSTVTNTHLRLHEAISIFTARDNAVHIKVHIEEPDTIERKLLEGKLNIGISAFSHHMPGLAYEELLTEQHGLYCGRTHPLFGKRPGEFSVDDVMAADAVVRGYISQRATGASGLKPSATAYNMEAILVMIRSGSYIGHLPLHYASIWVKAGELWQIDCEQLKSSSKFEVVYRNGANQLSLIKTFLSDLRKAHEPSILAGN